MPFLQHRPIGWLCITYAGQIHIAGLLTTICSTAALLLSQLCLLLSLLRCSSCLLQSCEQRHDDWRCPAAPMPILSQRHCLVFSCQQQCCMLSEPCRLVNSATVGHLLRSHLAFLRIPHSGKAAPVVAALLLASFCGWCCCSCAAGSTIGCSCCTYVLTLQLRCSWRCSVDGFAASTSVVAVSLLAALHWRMHCTHGS